MKLGLTTMTLDEYFSDEEILSLYKDAGFDYIDYYFSRYKPKSPYFEEDAAAVTAYYKNLKKKADGLGVKFYQTHAPYPTYTGNAQKDKKIFEAIIISIMASSILGAEHIVIHPQMPYLYHYGIFKPLRKALNMKFYRALLPYLEEYNIKCAIENMFCRRRRDKKLVKTVCSTAEEMIAFQDSLKSPYFSLCVDIGHANIIYKDGGIEMLSKLNSRIKALHLHDNFYKEDDHLYPGKGINDWKKVVEKLKEIGFDGVINLECHSSVIKGGKECVKNNLKEIYNSSREIFKDF